MQTDRCCRLWLVWAARGIYLQLQAVKGEGHMLLKASCALIIKKKHVSRPKEYFNLRIKGISNNAV